MTVPMREAHIDLAAVRDNLRVIARTVAPARTMAVVKAQGYGHGAVEVARAAVDAGADWLGVVDVAEALELRAAGIDAPILAWLHGQEADFAAAVRAGIDLGISTPEQLERAAAVDGLAQVHLKVDTGLSRNGFEESEFAAILGRVAELSAAGRIHVRGIFSHLANAGAEEDALQIARFEAALARAAEVGIVPELRHLAATAAALRVPASRFDLVRIGIGMYGLTPFDDEGAAALGLRPAMRLSAEITSVKRVPAGAGVSYGYTQRTSSETTLALVPAGYADGIPRHASSRAPVWINGSRYSICGRVAMDQFVVDVGDAPVAIGDRAVLFGDPSDGYPSADEWAERCGTINYEIVTRIGGRFTRTYS
ncbi:alanine racemase [Galbitalea soli]|uniref:Alanine racemase n=1 Tax=Galbitalea soli TaxID=1268042 RepID=A0A7C9TQK5_9MICO|nr:alanine racemase [Galbitalea soli]NEM91255.1 alanine racemase [Galbitalea soli]NYJ29944.1 alanine racemase [Galbitalea soli]